MSADDVKVTVTFPTTTRDGKDRQPGDTVSLPEGEAVRLVHDGRAVPNNSKAEPADTKGK